MPRDPAAGPPADDRPLFDPDKWRAKMLDKWKRNGLLTKPPAPLVMWPENVVSLWPYRWSRRKSAIQNVHDRVGLDEPAVGVTLPDEPA